MEYRHGSPLAAILAVSSRGLGRGPLKAQTRVRIPLPLFGKSVWPVRLSVRTAPFHGAERGSIPLRAIVGSAGQDGIVRLRVQVQELGT